MNSPEVTSKLLIKESPLQVLPTLAVRIGLNEAMVLQQLHYRLLAKDSRGNRLAHFRDGHYWYYNSYEGWQRLHFKFWSPRTIRRALKSLEVQGLIITKKFRRGGGDHKRWYTVNYPALIALELEPGPISSTSDELAKLATSDVARLASTDMANLAKTMANWPYLMMWPIWPHHIIRIPLMRPIQRHPPIEKLPLTHV